MEVGTSAPDTPYAVMGGGQAQKFQIAQSAHGFKILSSTLYRDKIRAVVRETLCNAIDAHIAAGVPDRPVEVTITDDAITFRDFGLGIPDGNMIDVYCTYFASTKTQDEKQTGGFGLGCKAPFAYSDHFTVVSRHAGVQSTYAIAIGSEQTAGAPSLRKMVSVPTEDQGLEVTIPIENANDVLQFTAKLKSVVYEGGMRVKLNGELLPCHDYDTDRERGFAYVPTDDRQGQIRVICGNVVYAVDGDAAINGPLAELRGYQLGGHHLVLMAAPNTVRPKPDREGLSYEEITLETLERLITRAVKHLKHQVERKMNEMLVAKIRATSRLELAEIAYYSFSLGDLADADSDAPRPYRQAIERLAAHKIRTFGYGLHKLIIRKALSHVREGRSSLKRAILDHSLNADKERLIRKRVLRIARLVGMEDRIYSRSSDQSVFRKLYALGRLDRYGERERGHGLGSHTLQICFVSTREEASSILESGFAIINNKGFTDEQIELLSAKAVKFGFKVSKTVREDYKPPKRSKRIKSEKPAFITLRTNRNENYSSRHLLPSVASETEPAAYFACGISRSERYYYRRNEGHEDGYQQALYATFAKALNSELFIDVQHFLPKTVVPVLRGELTQLRKEKVPLYQEIMLERATKRIKRPVERDIASLVYSFSRHNCHDIGLSWEVANGLQNLLPNPRMLHVVLGLRWSPKLEESYRFWRHIEQLRQATFSSNALIPEEATRVDDVSAKLETMMKEATKTAEHPIVKAIRNFKTDKAPAEALVRQLQPFQSILTYCYRNVFENAELGPQLLAFERKRLSAKAKTTPQPLEGEAA